MLRLKGRETNIEFERRVYAAQTDASLHLKNWFTYVFLPSALNNLLSKPRFSLSTNFN